MIFDRENSVNEPLVLLEISEGDLSHKFRPVCKYSPPSGWTPSGRWLVTVTVKGMQAIHLILVGSAVLLKSFNGSDNLLLSTLLTG
jgi:hypothetical protein